MVPVHGLLEYFCLSTYFFIIVDFYVALLFQIQIYYLDFCGLLFYSYRVLKNSHSHVLLGTSSSSITGF